MKKTVYKKAYNRFLPLMAVEEWYQGERVVLPKVLNKNIYFNHLFVHNLEKGIDVYYDENQLSKGIKKFMNYFKKNPNKFNELAEVYKNESKEMLAFCKKSGLKDIPKLKDLIINKIWPMLNIILILGNYSNEYNLHNIGKQALELRKKYDTHIYTLGQKIYLLSKQKFPKNKKYLDLLTFKEISTGKIPSIRELEK